MTMNRTRFFGKLGKLGVSLLTVLAVAQVASALPPPLPPLKPARRQVKQSNAEMTFYAKEFEFGQIFNTEPQTTEFKFKNTGSDPLEIGTIKPSCGCTLANMYRLSKDATGAEVRETINTKVPGLKVFQPGEEGIIEVTFNPKGKRGPQNRSISISSNDRHGKRITIRMTGFVKSIVEIDPALVGFGQVPKGMGSAKTIHVYGRTPDFEVTKVSFQTPGLFEATILGTEMSEKYGEQMRATAIEVRLKKNAPPNVHNTKMYIRTNDERATLVDANVFARVMGDLEAVPARLSFGVMQVGDAINTEFRVRHRQGQAFTIKSVEVGSQAALLEFSFKPVDPKARSEWIVTVTGEASRAAPRLAGLVTVVTDIPDEETIELPMNASIRDIRSTQVGGRQPGRPVRP